MSSIFEYDEFNINSPSRPRWVKAITDSSGVEHRTLLNFENKEELAKLSVSDIYKHLGNLVQYMRDISTGIAPVGLNDPLPKDGWHLQGNWGEVEWAKEECLKWWRFVYYNEEEEEEEEEEPENV
jgi:hypothetical protein